MPFEPTSPPRDPGLMAEYLSRELSRLAVELRSTGWVAAQLQNGWTNFGAGYSDIQFRRDPGGLVTLRGVANGGTGTSGTVLFTLPAGHRPMHRMVFNRATGAGGSVRPYVYGHGVRMLAYASNEDVYDSNPTAVDLIIKPKIKSITVRYAWHLLEPPTSTQTNPVFDFGDIDNVLTYIEDNDLDLKFTAEIEDRSFNNGILGNVSHTPQWLKDLGLDINYDLSGGGFQPVYWDSRVVDAQVRLHVAVYNQFKNRPAFLGTHGSETALGMSQSLLDQYNYSAASYRDALIDRLQGIGEGAVGMRHYFHMNFLPQGQAMLDTVNAAVAPEPYGIAIGSPDILHENSSINTLVIPRFTNVATAVPTSHRFGQCQFASFMEAKTGGGYYTPLEQKNRGRDTYQVHKIFWTRVPNPQAVGAYDIDDAYAMIESEDDTELDTYTGGVSGDTEIARVDIDRDGNVVLVDGIATDNWISLDGITFVAEA